MDFKLNFLGVTVADFEPSYRFYTEVLGIEARHSKPDWAYLETTGMTFELFGIESSELSAFQRAMLPTSDRSWGRRQTIRPSFQIAELESTVSDLRRKGVEFVGDIERTTWGERIEFIATEGFRWTLAHAPSYPFGSSMRKPHLGWVQIKAHDLAGQQSFYTGVMGLRPEEGDEGQFVLRQRPGQPLMFLEPGGQQLPAIQSRKQSPHFISFETDNIERATAYMKTHNVLIIQDVTREDWGGIDIYIKDVDGNPVQVVQYVTAT